MYKSVFFIFLTILSCNSNKKSIKANTASNTESPFLIEIEPFTIADAPSIQSYSYGKTSDDKWLIVGGRTEGLHKRRPFEAFLRKDNNTNIFLIDPIKNTTLKADLSVLPNPIFEQLQATNQEFIQRNNTLYIIGGYGYSATMRNHITYPNLTAIDIDGVAKAITNKEDITQYFRQIHNEKLAVTGGQLGILDNTFYLCGGQYFKGRYNPMGPNHGPGFTQEYTNEIRTFNINDDGKNLALINYKAIKDTDNLHRRDYNMVPQIFPDNTQGFTMFSGVFQYTDDIPWLNTVDINKNGYKVNNNFKQYLSQYHSAKVPVYNSKTKAMMTVFFGGLSQFQFNNEGLLIEDNQIPFVKTISLVTRHKNSTMTELDLGVKMPAFLGSGAEFITAKNKSIYLDDEIVNFSSLKKGKTLIGYIFGGIHSYKQHVFFTNNSHQSMASNQVFKVYIVK